MFCYKKLILALAAVILSLTNTSIAYAQEPVLSADAAVLMDSATGQVFFAKEPDKRRFPASLTKIMTALVALENGDPNDVVKISKKAASVSVGSVIDLRAGEEITLENLLKAALVCSANDSTVAIAEHVGGNVENFLVMMNARALSAGAVNTNYANTNGYTLPNHYTTAYDLALIARQALRNKQFNRLISIKETTLNWEGNKNRTLEIRNTNRLLREGFPGIDGVKTGSTPRAGDCLIASASRNGRRLIAVVLHSNNRYTDAANILNYGFKEIKSYQVFKKGEQVVSVPVTEGVLKEVPLITQSGLQIDITDDKISLLRKKFLFKNSVTAPVKSGQVLGEIICSLENREVGRISLVAGDDIERKSWLRRKWEKLSVSSGINN
jgi:D-alanyl-D-alanine carboxypeptidase (penicillin-binding protein 5/6)